MKKYQIQGMLLAVVFTYVVFAGGPGNYLPRLREVTRGKSCGKEIKTTI